MISSPKRSYSSGYVLGIDATNIRIGGGLTHLIELLRHADVRSFGFSRIIVWGSRETLALLDDADWLLKQCPPALDRGIIKRSLWQRFCLAHQARRTGCDILLVPGGNFTGEFSPIVAISQNMLPFEWRELARYGFSYITLRLLLLRRLQSSTFDRAAGLIFLSEYSRRVIQRLFPSLSADSCVIPHGISDRFRLPPRPQRPIHSYSLQHPFRILYVSSVDPYKHQWNLVEAVARLRLKEDWPLALDLVGTVYTPSLRRLRRAMAHYDPLGKWITFHGAIEYKHLHLLYHRSDLGVFASSCETMPNILLETMSSGLPVACSFSGPMPEILDSCGVYFDPLCPIQIASALADLIADPLLRTTLSSESFARSHNYLWHRCASDTFSFLSSIVNRHDGHLLCAE